MISCRMLRSDSTFVELPAPSQWSFSYGAGLPCDSFYIRCPWEQGREKELSDTCLFHADRNGQRVFTGVVDEYTCLCGQDGFYLEVSGRGMAARLLDNESFAAQYARATLPIILDHHVKPYGIKVAGDPLSPPVSNYCVQRGGSQWSALYNFTYYRGGIIPRFDTMGRLVLERFTDDVTLTVDGKSPVTQWSYREQRYGVLSQVSVRRSSSNQVYRKEDMDFILEGGSASRVLSVPKDTRLIDMRHEAEYQLKASQSERVRLYLTLAEGFAAWPGDLVDVRCAAGANGRYHVLRAEVSCDGRGLSTHLELCEQDAMTYYPLTKE